MKSSYAHDKSDTKYKGTRRRMRLLMAILLCFMGWAAVTLWDQMDKVDAKDSQLQHLENKLMETQKLHTEFQNEVERLNDPEYIEQRIYKDLQMTKDGETLFIQTK